MPGDTAVAHIGLFCSAAYGRSCCLVFLLTQKYAAGERITGLTTTTTKATEGFYSLLSVSEKQQFSEPVSYFQMTLIIFVNLLR